MDALERMARDLRAAQIQRYKAYVKKTDKPRHSFYQQYQEIVVTETIGAFRAASNTYKKR